MRYEYIEPFVRSTVKVLDSVIQCDITKGTAALVKGDEITDDIAIVVRLRGDSEGNIILNMPEDTALKVCNAMFGDVSGTLTSLGMDSIAELANMIAGNAASVLNDMGYDLTVSPPLIIRKDEIKGETLEVEAFRIPLFTEYGEMTMNVALRTN